MEGGQGLATPRRWGSTAEEKLQRLSGERGSKVPQSTLSGWRKREAEIQQNAQDPIFAERKKIRRGSVMFQVGPRVASFRCEWYSQLQSQGQAISERDFKKGVRDKAVELYHELRKGKSDYNSDWGKGIVEWMRSWRKTFKRGDGFPGEEELAAWRASNNNSSSSSSSKVEVAGPAPLAHGRQHEEQQDEEEEEVLPRPRSSGFQQLVKQTSSGRGQKRHCAPNDKISEAVLKKWMGPLHDYHVPPALPNGEDPSSTVFGLFPAIYEERGIMCSFRWVLGGSTERGALILGADEVFRTSCALGVDWMLANMESLRERYGEPKVDPGKREVVLYNTCTHFNNVGPSASVPVTAGLVAFCWGTKLRSEVLSTGEVTLTGGLRAVGGIKEKVQAACAFGTISTVVVPQGNTQAETGYLYELPLESDTAEATTANPTPPEEVEEGRDNGQQGGSQPRQLSREEYGPGIIEFDDDPEVWRRLEDGSLSTMSLNNMWEVLDELVIPPPGRERAPEGWVPGRGAWQASLFSPWLNQDGLVCMQLVEVSFMRTRPGWLRASGCEGPACNGAATAHVFVRTCLEKVKAKLPYPPRPYDEWLTTDEVKADGVPQFHVHFPPLGIPTKYIFSAAVAVGMVAVMYGRTVAVGTVVMGDVEPGGGLIDLPPMHGRHFQAMVKGLVKKAYMPRGNAEQVMALPEYAGSGLEVVAMDNLLDHIDSILSPA